MILVVILIYIKYIPLIYISLFNHSFYNYIKIWRKSFRDRRIERDRNKIFDISPKSRCESNDHSEVHHVQDEVGGEEHETRIERRAQGRKGCEEKGRMTRLETIEAEDEESAVSRLLSLSCYAEEATRSWRALRLHEREWRALCEEQSLHTHTVVLPLPGLLLPPHPPRLTTISLLQGKRFMRRAREERW